MRLHLLRAAAALAVFVAGGCAFEPRYPIEPGAAPGRGVVLQQPAYPIDPPPDAPRAAFDPASDSAPVLVSAVDYVEAAPLWRVSSRHPTLRRRLDADADTAAPARKRKGRKAKADDDAQAAEVTVRAGDTLYSLAGRSHVTVEAVASLNGLKAPYALKPGRVLKLPGSAPSAKPEAASDEPRPACPTRRGRKACLAKAAAAEATAETAASTPRERRKAAAQAAEALKTAQAACPRHKGRKACLAATQKEAAVASPSAGAEDITSLADAKARCPKHRGRRACLAAAEMTAKAAPTADAASAMADARAKCPRRRGRNACLAAAEKTAKASVAEDTASSVADAEAKCPRRRGRRACLAAAEQAVASDGHASRRNAADAATAALNLKACRRRHNRRVCAARAADAPDDTPVVASTARVPSRSVRQALAPASAPTPAPDAGVSAESMVASLPPTSKPPTARTQTRLGGDAASIAAAPSASASIERGRSKSSTTAEPSPGPRPYASVFGSDAASVRTPARPAHDRSGRTSQDAQAAAAAAARRDYARASIPAAPAPVGADAATGRPRFSWPVTGNVISGFGPKGSGLRNDGVDLAASLGDPVKASAAGEVVYAGGAIPGFGNLVLVKHAGGYVTAYGHLSKISVAMRQAVRQGDVVGEVGQSGNVAQPELHFEIRFAATPEENAKPVDPAPLLPRRG